MGSLPPSGCAAQTLSKSYLSSKCLEQPNFSETVPYALNASALENWAIKKQQRDETARRYGYLLILHTIWGHIDKRQLYFQYYILLVFIL